MAITAVSLLGQQPPQQGDRQGGVGHPSRLAVPKSVLTNVTPAKDVVDGAVKVSFSQRANLVPNAGGQNQQIQQTDSSRFGQVTTMRLSPSDGAATGGGIGGIRGGAAPSGGGMGGVAPPGAAIGGGATIQFSEDSSVCFVAKG